MPTDPAPRQHAPPRARAVRLLLAVAAAALVVAGCSSQDEEQTRPDLLGPRLEAARTAIDDAASLRISLSTRELPDGVTGLLQAEGRGDDSPAFDGDVRVSSSGTAIDAKVVAVDGKVYAQLPFTQGFNEVDPADFGAPDPASLLADDTGVSRLLEVTDDLSAGDRTRDGEDVLTAVDGTLPGADVQRLVPTADDSATFDVSYRLTDDDTLRDASIRGPFYGDADPVTYRLSVELSDEAVDITAPSGS